MIIFKINVGSLCNNNMSLLFNNASFSQTSSINLIKHNLKTNNLFN
jgi:hypothetical protein